MNQHYYLSAMGRVAQPMTTAKLPKERNGLPCFYYWRQSIRDGLYKHPIKGWTLSVDGARRQKWEEVFRKALANGVELPIVKDHKHTADSTIGYVMDVRQSGPWMEELHQYIGVKDRDTALKNYVSVGIDPEMKDGEGREYGEGLIHSAIVPDPVVPGQGDAIPIAASRGQQDGVDVFLFAASEGSDMDLRVTLAALLGLAAAGLTDEAVVNKVKELQGSIGEKDRQLQASKAKADELDAKILTLSKGAAQPDPELLDSLLTVDTERLDSLVEKGAIDAATRDKIKLLFKTADGKPSGFMLSRTVSGTATRLSNMLIEALKENKPVSLGVKSGVQQLSRTDGDGKPVDGAPAKVDQAWVEERVRSVGGQVAAKK